MMPRRDYDSFFECWSGRSWYISPRLFRGFCWSGQILAHLLAAVFLLVPGQSWPMSWLYSCDSWGPRTIAVWPSTSAAKEIVANYVDFMLRKLLSEGNVVCISYTAEIYRLSRAGVDMGHKYHDKNTLKSLSFACHKLYQQHMRSLLYSPPEPVFQNQAPAQE
eukprot:s774_g9.t1